MKCGNPPTVFDSNELWVLTVQNHSHFKKKIVSLVVRIGEYPPGREIFMLWKKSGKEEITLYQSKSLENVKVRKIRAARINKKAIQGNPLIRISVSITWFKDSATWIRTQSTVSEMHGGNCRGNGPAPPPTSKPSWRKKCLVSCSLIQHYTLLSNIKTAAQPLGCWTFLQLIQP